MKKIVSKIFFILTSCLSLNTLSAAIITWGGPNTELDLPTNWIGGILPTSVDIASFNGSPPNTIFYNGSTAPTFNVAGMVFLTDYTIINSPGMSGLQINIGSSGVNTSDAPTISIINGGSLNFLTGSSANIGVGQTTYALGTASDVYLNTINFNGTSTASNAIFNVSGDGVAIPELVFNDNSSLGAAQINGLNGATININTTTTTSTAKLVLNNSVLNILSGPMSFDSIASDSAGGLSINGFDLTINNPNGEAISGSIFEILGTGGRVIKNGVGTLTIDGFGSDYSGGTIVNAGTLITNGISVPLATLQPSLTVNNSATAVFDNFSPGVDFTGDILLNSPTTTLSLSNSEQLIISGNILGTGQVVVPTGTDLLLAGTGNTYSGGSQVSGKLTGDLTTLQGAINLTGGTLVVNQNDDAAFNLNITGDSASTLVKDGAGILSVNAPIPLFTGTTNVTLGTLNLNAFLSGSVNVTNMNAILTGTGTVGGDLHIFSGGSVSPGNSIGTLNVNGNYIQDSGSAYILEFDGLGNSDLINVAGTATLAGDVFAISLDGQALLNTPYTILTAAGGVVGEFDGIELDNLMLQAEFIYDANNVYAIFSQLGFTFDAVTSNQIAVATQLEGITDPTAEEFLILSTLAGLSAEEQQTALDQMSGVQYTNAFINAEINSHQFIRRLYDPLRSIVTTIPCCQDYDCCYDPCQNIDIWFEAGGGRTFIEGTSNSRGFHTNEWQVTGGIQTTLQREWTIGLAGSYVNDQVSYNVAGSGKNQTAYVGLYGLYRPDRWYILADAAFGYSEYKVRRSIAIDTLLYTARSKPEIYQGLGYIEGGFDCPWNCVLIQPFLGFEFSYFDRNGFTESGASPLNLVVSKKNHTNVFSRLGAHLTSTQLPYNLSFSLDLAWQYRITDIGNSINERFESFGDTFTIRGLHFGHSSLDAAATITARIFENCDVYLEASGEKWSRASTYNFLGGVKFSW